MQTDRPKLTDPKELEIIKSIYFKDRFSSEVDPIEKLDRLESKQRFNHKSSR